MSVPEKVGAGRSSAGAGALFAGAAAIMARLRAPGGCPWDREQTPDSIRKYTLEETYEVLDAIERRDWPNLCEELGDLLLQVLFYAEMAQEAGHFSLEDVIETLNRKLVRRHPHVFGEEAARAAGMSGASLPEAGEAQAVVANWEEIKKAEREAKGANGGARRSDQAASYLDGVVRAQGSLGEAKKLGSAARKAGFDWPDETGWLGAVREELAEVEAELAGAAESVAEAEARRARLHEEYGDLLFTVANLSRALKLDPEMALRDANAKFRRRFTAMERGSARLLEELTLDELEAAWKAAKASERETLA